MNLKQHPGLTVEKWRAFPFFKRLLMIGNEINRAGNWIERNDPDEVNSCYERALELVDLTLATVVRPGLRKELLRYREVLGLQYLATSKNFLVNQALYRVLLSLDPGSFAVLPK
jgi:hypothetical protein